MSETNERSVASHGSVAGEPVAWAVTLADGERIYDVYAIEEEAKAIDEAVTGNHGVIPLYRSPTLTDAERALLSRLGEDTREWYKYSNGRPWFVSVEDSATLRSLLERLQ